MVAVPSNENSAQATIVQDLSGESAQQIHSRGVIEPSGAIAFEWDLGPFRWLVFALKGTGTIEHSAMLGIGNEQWGTRNFAGTLASMN